MATTVVSEKTDYRLDREDIYEALAKISETLADSYLQVKRDIQDEARLTWAGTAHEIRQIIASLLEILAPDAEVISQRFYKQDPHTSGPTQKQRTHYILQIYNAGSKERAVVEQIANLDVWIEDLVRATYSRASDAAHRYKERREVLRILGYFEAFSQDLLNIE